MWVERGCLVKPNLLNLCSLYLKTRQCYALPPLYKTSRPLPHFKAADHLLMSQCQLYEHDRLHPRFASMPSQPATRERWPQTRISQNHQ